MVMEGDYLRIVTPKPDRFGGPWYVDGVLQTSEIHAPLTARKGFEEENKHFESMGRPELKHRITLVSAEPLQTYSRPIAPAMQEDKKPARKPTKPISDDIFE
jgi:hypothetical protein